MLVSYLAALAFAASPAPLSKAEARTAAAQLRGAVAPGEVERGTNSEGFVHVIHPVRAGPAAHLCERAFTVGFLPGSPKDDERTARTFTEYLALDADIRPQSPFARPASCEAQSGNDGFFQVHGKQALPVATLLDLLSQVRRGVDNPAWTFECLPRRDDPRCSPASLASVIRADHLQSIDRNERNGQVSYAYSLTRTRWYGARPGGDPTRLTVFTSGDRITAVQMSWDFNLVE